MGNLMLKTGLVDLNPCPRKGCLGEVRAFGYANEPTMRTSIRCSGCFFEVDHPTREAAYADWQSLKGALEDAEYAPALAGLVKAVEADIHARQNGVDTYVELNAVVDALAAFRRVSK